MIFLSISAKSKNFCTSGFIENMILYKNQKKNLKVISLEKVESLSLLFNPKFNFFLKYNMKLTR